jgi:hypothetical protein
VLRGHGICAGRPEKKCRTAAPLTNIAARMRARLSQADSIAAGCGGGKMAIKGSSTASKPRSRKWRAQRRASLSGRVTMTRMARTRLGPVHTIYASANAVMTAPIQARDDAKAGRLG